MKLNLTSIREMYRLNHMVRYNTWPRINNETVASHSYYTSLFTMVLCDVLGVSLAIKLEAIQLALVHDTPETIINDITYDAKQKLPGLDEIVKPFEKEFINEHFPMLSSPMEVSQLIVKIADVLSVTQYCDNEVLLGNKRFKPLLNESFKRIEKLKEQLEMRGIPCQKIMV